MAHHTQNPSSPRKSGSRISQAVFIAIGLAIIAAGLWFLYESSAPYHPDVYGAEGELIVPSDS